MELGNKKIGKPLAAEAEIFIRDQKLAFSEDWKKLSLQAEKEMDRNYSNPLQTLCFLDGLIVLALPACNGGGFAGGSNGTAGGE